MDVDHQKEEEYKIGSIYFDSKEIVRGRCPKYKIKTRNNLMKEV